MQFTEEDWETFVMRNRNYVVPDQQVIGDTNPDRPDHWLKKRCDEGLTTLLNSFTTTTHTTGTRRPTTGPAVAAITSSAS